MNDLIRKFAKKSGFSLDQDNIYTAKLEHLPITENMEKFAELIVQECAQVAHNTQYKHSPAHTVGDCATAIKEHFEVGMSTEDKKTLIKELLGVKND